jgi:hypothetical protein
VPTQVDFLPARYREAHAKRHQHRWRIAVVAVFAGLLTLAAWAQHQRRRSVERDFAACLKRYDQAQQVALRVQRLEGECQALRAEADLAAYLQHTWPASRIVASLLEGLPETIGLESLHVQPSAEQTAAAPTARERRSNTDAQETRLPAEQDLDRLLAEAAAERQIVLLAGQARDLARLHAWLADLAAKDLFERAELLSLEAGEEQGAAATFTARVVVRPAHGEPGGPDVALAAAETGPPSVPSREE